MGSGNHTWDERAHWRNLANTTEPSVCGDDAALCQFTLTTCYGRPMKYGRPLYFCPVVSSIYLSIFFLSSLLSFWLVAKATCVCAVECANYTEALNERLETWLTCTSTTKKTTPTIRAKFELNQFIIDLRQPWAPKYRHVTYHGIVRKYVSKWVRRKVSNAYS